MSVADKHSLLLLAAFSRALAHKVRTPLAVISNELSFLSATDPESAATAATRAAEISKILKSACRVTSAKVHRESVLLASLLGPLPESLEGATVRGDPTLFAIAFEGLREIFNRYGEAAGSLVVQGEQRDNELVRLTITGRWRQNVGIPEQFFSLSELIAERLALDSIEAPIFDAVMRAHGINTEVLYDSTRLAVSLQMPTDSDFVGPS